MVCRLYIRIRMRDTLVKKTNLVSLIIYIRNISKYIEGKCNEGFGIRRFGVSVSKRLFC